MLLCVVCVVSASKKQLFCGLKRNIMFFPTDQRMTTCELKHVKFVPGKQLRLNGSEVTYEELRVQFVESNVQAIPKIIFDEFRKLEVLEMNGVGLRNIFEQSFSRADSLKVFQAFGNKMTTLNGYSFKGATVLEILDLSSNLLSNINFETFSGLDHLKQLSLSNNRISILDDQVFLPLVNLTWLWLDRNHIKIVAVNLLINSPKLEGLYLNDNKIRALSPIIFDKLPDLKFLFLSNNNCTNKDFVNAKISHNSNVKTELATCFKEFRVVVPDEEEKFRLKQVLRDAEKANSQCETDKTVLLERLETTRQQLANLQYKNGK